MNIHQIKFLKDNNIDDNSNPLESMMSDLKYIEKSYSVFGPFRKKVLMVLDQVEFNYINLSRSAKIISRIINKTETEPYDISSYMANSNIGLFESILIVNQFKSNQSKYNYLLNQFIWRAFYYQVTIPQELYEKHWPVDRAIQNKFFKGRTGYDIIDAAIVCLRSTGKMSNRNRMVCAIFFCKNLLQPWMDGEKFFKRYLEDYDLYLNRGNWIWSSQLKFDNQRFVRFISPILELKRLMKNKILLEWYELWKQPKCDIIIDYKESCTQYRNWLISSKKI